MTPSLFATVAKPAGPIVILLLFQTATAAVENVASKIVPMTTPPTTADGEKVLLTYGAGTET
jgi:hypothetical protein